jgi:hypothetical protein
VQRLLRAWYWVLAFLLVGAGCGDPFSTEGHLHLPVADSYDFWIDDSVSAENVAAEQAAVAQWRTYTDVKVTLHYGFHICIEDGCFRIIEVPQATLDKVVGENYIGWTTPYLITLTPPLSWDEAQDTAIHEDGHAFGLWHPCTAPCALYAVMNPTYSEGADHVACMDVANYYLERGLPGPPAGTAPCTDAPGSLTVDPSLK